MARSSDADLATLPRSREEAQARRFDRYYSGAPCKHGHLAARYVSTTNCARCQVEHARKNGGWCARPSKQEYFTQARDLIAMRNGTLLSTKYVSAISRLHVRCDRAHDFETTYDRLRQGKWCPKCKSDNHAERMARDYRPVEELREFACGNTTVTAWLQLRALCRRKSAGGAPMKRILHSKQPSLRFCTVANGAPPVGRRGENHRNHRLSWKRFSHWFGSAASLSDNAFGLQSLPPSTHPSTTFGTYLPCIVWASTLLEESLPSSVMSTCDLYSIPDRLVREPCRCCLSLSR
jgi:hypothetical protein